MTNAENERQEVTTNLSAADSRSHLNGEEGDGSHVGKRVSGARRRPGVAEQPGTASEATSPVTIYSGTTVEQPWSSTDTPPSSQSYRHQDIGRVRRVWRRPELQIIIGPSAKN